MENNKTLKIIDNAIFVFVIIFLASLTNSIFVNQLGYYGALLLVLIRYAVTKENPFSKNGLGIALVLFLSAELISAIFSNNHHDAFNNLLKRALLVPLLYLMPAVTKSEERGKLFVKVFIAAAFIMIGIYLVVAYEYVINRLYAVEQKGPSVFKFVMTAGGIISFITIIVFAFLINEKVKMKYKILLGVLFVMSSISLLANYSRAAWLGGAMGIATILFVKKKYIILSVPVLLVVGYLIAVPNKSFVRFYKLADDKITELKTINTEGKAKSAWKKENQIIISDYENGLLVNDFNSVTQHIKNDYVTIRVDQWGQSIYPAYYSNNKYIVYKYLNNKLNKITSFTTAGMVVNMIGYDNKFYIAHRDSGLVVKTNPENVKEEVIINELYNFVDFTVSKKVFACYSNNNNSLLVYSIVNGIPKQKIYEEQINTQLTALFQNGNYLLFQTDGGLKIYTVDSNNVVTFIKQDESLKNITRFACINGENYGFSLYGDVYKFTLLNNFSAEKLKDKILPISWLETGLSVSGDTIIVAYNKRNRIGSILDPHHITNIERINQWATGMRILKDNPIFGVGDIDMNKVYQKYRAPYERENFGHLHNNYVHLLAILGLFGFCAVMFLFVKVFMVNIKIYKSVKEIPFISSFALGVMAMFVGFLFSGLAEWNFGDHEIITLVWFLVGLNIAFYKLVNNKTVNE